MGDGFKIGDLLNDERRINELEAQLTKANELLREARQHINDPLTVGKSYLLERITDYLEET